MAENINLANLTSSDIDHLIAAEKNPDNLLEYQDIMNQIISTLVFSNKTLSCTVIDHKRSLTYRFSVHTTPLETNFSVGLMFEANHYHLLRLDFGDNLRHTNNQGTSDEYVVIGSHAHINSPSNKYTPKNVLPIGKLADFVNIKLIRDAINQYTKTTNIKAR